MDLLEKIKQKVRTVHKARDFKKAVKVAVKIVDDSGLEDDVEKALDEIYAQIVIIGLLSLADLIASGKEAIPELKQEAFDILDDAQEYLKGLLK